MFHCISLLSVMSFNLFHYTDEHDLQKVLREIRSVSHVQNLGLALGVLMSLIDKTREDYALVEDQKIEVMYCWLRRTDILREKQSCLPTWSELADAVADENVALSEEIRRKCRD